MLSSLLMGTMSGHSVCERWIIHHDRAPVHDDGFFTFYELVTEEARRAGLSSNGETGLVTATLSPKRWFYFLPLPLVGPGSKAIASKSSLQFILLYYTNPEEFVTINLHKLGGTKKFRSSPAQQKRQMPLLFHPSR